MNFAKVAADLDSHPKVRKAGREGREVFLFLLRRNALTDSDGRLPVANIDPEYLADQLMMDAVTASHGVSRAVTAGLLRVTGEFVVIAGWDDAWSKRPMTPAERQAKKRAKQSAIADLTADVTKSHAPSVTSHACHALEEKRREEKRVEEKVAAPPAERGPVAPKSRKAATGDHAEAIAAFDRHFAAAYGTKPTWGAKQGAQINRLLKAHGLAEFTRRVEILFSAPPSWLKPPYDVGTLEQHFDKLAAPAAAVNQNVRTGRIEPAAQTEFSTGEVSL